MIGQRRLATQVLACAFLAAAAAAAFAPALGNGFLDYDDDEYVTGNPRVLEGLTPGGIAWAFTTFHASNWHPLAWLSHMLDVEIFGLDPAGHHGTSLLLHAACAIVLFLVLERATGAFARSLFAAALFAVHPLRVESVAWIAERKDVLSALLWLLVLLLWTAWTRSPRPARYAGVVVLAALALLAKPMPVTLPLTLVLLDYWPLRRLGPGLAGVRRALVEKWPLLVLSVASAAVTIAAQQAARGIVPVTAVPLPARLANAVVSYAAYLGDTLFPSGLAAFYPHPGSGLSAWRVLAAAAILAALSCRVIAERKRRPYLLFGWLWYAITLLPVAGLVQVGEQARADRYTYVPLIGLFVMIAWGGGEALEALSRAVARRRGGTWGTGRPARALAVAPAIAAVLVFVPLTREQVRVWRDTETLFTHALAVTESNHTAHASLGVLRGRQGRLDEAEAQLREAIRIRPGDASARNNLGTALFSRGDLALAIEQFREAVRLDPRSAGARKNLGIALLRDGRTDEAIAAIETAARLALDDAGLLCAWGDALATAGRYREAEARYSRAAEIDPSSAPALFGLAAARHAAGDVDGARRALALSRARGIEPPASLVRLVSP